MLMPKHSLENLTLYGRLVNLELDMTAVHDAINRLAGRIDELAAIVAQREQSHIESVNAQIDRADTLIARLRDEPTEHQAPEATADPSHPESLLDPSEPPSHY
jgi:hypothetical protein